MNTAKKQSVLKQLFGYAGNIYGLLCLCMCGTCRN